MRPVWPRSDVVDLPADLAGPLRAIAGVHESSNKIYVVGNSATVLIGDGRNAFVASATSPSPSGNLRAVYVPSAQEAWVADSSNNTVHHTTNGGATWTNSVAGAAGGLQGIFGRSANDILTVGQDNMEGRHYMSGWAAARYPGPLKRTMWGVFASANNFYITGSGGAVGKSASPRTTFQDISLTSSTPNLYGVFCVDDNNVFVVGSGGAIYRYNGSQWSSMSQGASTLKAIWGSSAQDIFVVGDSGAVYHYDGTRWQNMSDSTVAGYNLTGVWGDGQGGVFVTASNSAGTTGAVFKY